MAAGRSPTAGERVGNTPKRAATRIRSRIGPRSSRAVAARSEPAADRTTPRPREAARRRRCKDRWSCVAAGTRPSRGADGRRAPLPARPARAGHGRPDGTRARCCAVGRPPAVRRRGPPPRSKAKGERPRTAGAAGQVLAQNLDPETPEERTAEEARPAARTSRERPCSASGVCDTHKKQAWRTRWQRGELGSPGRR